MSAAAPLPATPARSLKDLPRGWLLASLEIGRAHELKAWVREAVEWGFYEPEGLTNNAKRILWLRTCREKAWTDLSGGKEAPARAWRPKWRSPAAIPSPIPGVSPRVDPDGGNIFPGRARPGKRHPDSRPPAADLCEVTAAEVNEMLRKMPGPECAL